ncbi:hypothetical protein ACIQF6_35860 [Kitasatospora sp. NPDC092948]|uniref:hypothetical protein n=1 Tax=Kitasatospora sp. NPDC092948 TaxID=3364088 RepID=UPI0037F19B05
MTSTEISERRAFLLRYHLSDTQAAVLAALDVAEAEDVPAAWCSYTAAVGSEVRAAYHLSEAIGGSIQETLDFAVRHGLTVHGGPILDRMLTNGALSIRAVGDTLVYEMATLRYISDGNYEEPNTTTYRILTKPPTWGPLGQTTLRDDTGKTWNIGRDGREAIAWPWR